MVLFVLSWRLGPVLAAVIIATAFTAAVYKGQTRVVERENAEAAAAMSNVASQAFESITTVRCPPLGADPTHLQPLLQLRGQKAFI